MAINLWDDYSRVGLAAITGVSPSDVTQLPSEVETARDSTSAKSIVQRAEQRATKPVIAPDRAILSPPPDLADLQALRPPFQVETQQTLQQPSAPRISDYSHYAEPLSPLKQRDLTALAELFQQNDIYQIEADITQMLLRLLPEPCWEEDPFEFLREFL